MRAGPNKAGSPVVLLWVAIGVVLAGAGSSRASDIACDDASAAPWVAELGARVTAHDVLARYAAERFESDDPGLNVSAERVFTDGEVTEVRVAMAL